jgi:hypothetical protein
MSFERARAIADAVLYEGYALYPYRASATKNRLRWQFGVVLPQGACGSEPWSISTDVLVDQPRPLRGQLRFLRVRRRLVETPRGERLDSLDVDGRLLLPWDEGEPCEVEFGCDLDSVKIHLVELPGDVAIESVTQDGVEVARVVRRRAPLRFRIRVTPSGEIVRVGVENLSLVTAGASREEALPSALIGTHFLLSGPGFVSRLEPPPEAEAAAKRCKSEGLYPVMVGDLVLCAPVILYDQPRVAPESPGDLFDASEIDEILTLRTRLLTDDEKRQARATDARVAALIDRVEATAPETLQRLHGTFRSPVKPGSRVRLRPGARRSDAQDLFLDGRVATVQARLHDQDGRACFAVTIDDDPAAELHDWHGRYHYFYADEIEPLG